MDRLTEIVKALPEMMAGKELLSAMTTLPDYDDSIRAESEAVRLMALSDLYQIYLPSQMSMEIYSKLYLALLRSLQKKGSKIAILQQYENHKAVRQQEYSGIIGGSDSFTIIGTSGIGKSTAISKALDLITASGIIEVKEPFVKVIPCIVVQCPFDSSVKGLLLEILRKVDECLDSKYYERAVRTRSTTDMIIGSVSQVALNHIGLLIVDEIQNVANSKNGKSLIGALTQLINNSGISICMVGTPESAVFFEQAMQLARRSLGLQYARLEYDRYFCDFCCTLFSYQYVKRHTDITPAIIEWLYEHSSGIVSVVVSLIHDAQEIAILDGREELSIETLNEAYQKRLSLLHVYIEPVKKRASSSVKPKKIIEPISKEPEQIGFTIAQLVSRAKEGRINIVDLLRDQFPVEEVVV